ncbi:MAG: tetratricopeptide repeat protein [Spirochaetota bacterium]
MSSEDINARIDGLLSSALKHFSKSDYDNAIEDLKAAEVLDCDNPEVLYNLGVAHSRQGLHKTAVTYYKKLLDLPFDFVELLTVKKLAAYSLILGEEYGEALSFIGQLLKSLPNDPAGNALSGFCHEKMGRIDEAIRSHAKVLEVDPGNINSCNSVAFLMARRGLDLDKALVFAKRALDTNPESAAYCDTVGYVYMKKNQPDLAKRFLKKAMEKEPANIEIRSHLNELLKI